MDKQTATSKPNVLLITFDTTRFDRLGCYGQTKVRTPVIDSLARDGARYERCYTVAPLTLPSHTSILTGLYPFAHGQRSNGAAALDPQAVTLAELLSDHGYRTGAFVSAFVLDARFGIDQGFETYNDDVGEAPEGQESHHAERNAEAVTDAAVSWLDAGGDHPWLLWVHYFDPHQPYAPPGMPPGTPNEEAYDLEIEYADSHLDRLLRRIDERDRSQDRDTITVFVADHGEAIHDHGELTHAFFVYNATIQVPLIVRIPGVTEPGSVVSRPVSVVDVFPTILNRLDIPLPYEIHGRLLPTGDAEVSSERRPLYLETHMPFDTYGWSPLEGVVVGAFKYIHAPKPEIYNVVADAGELRNLWSDDAKRNAEYAAALQQLRSRALSAPALSGKESESLEPDETTALRQLGYVGTPSQPPDDRSGLKNPADMIDVHNAALHAWQSRNENDFDSCARWLAQVLERDKHNRSALQLLSELMQDPNTSSHVQELTANALSRGLPQPFDAQLSISLAMTLGREGRLDDVALILEQLVTRHPDSKEGHNALAETYLATGRITDAETSARKALALNAAYAPALETLGDVAAHSGRYAEAIKFYEQGASKDAPSATLLLKMADAHAAQGNLDAAAERYRKAVQSNPQLAVGWIGLARTSSDRGDWTGATRTLRDGAIANPQHAGLRYDLGYALFQSGDAAGAADAFQTALKIDNQHGQAAISLGIALAAVGEQDEAITALMHATTIESSAADAFFNLGVAYVKTGAIDKAIEQYEQALKLRPDNEQAIQELLRQYLGRGDAANAVRVLLVAVEHFPNHLAYNNMAAAILATSRSDQTRDADRAVRLAEHAVSLSGGQNAEVLGTLAAAYAEKGAFDRAVETAQKAIELARSNGQAKLAEQLVSQEQLYEAAKPYRDPRF